MRKQQKKKCSTRKQKKALVRSSAGADGMSPHEHAMCAQPPKARSITRMVLEWVDLRPPFQNSVPAPGRGPLRRCLLRAFLGFPLTYLGVLAGFYSFGTSPGRGEAVGCLCVRVSTIRVALFFNSTRKSKGLQGSPRVNERCCCSIPGCLRPNPVV